MEAEKPVALKKIKYCGNCNPEVHPKHIRNIVEKIADEKGPDTLVLVNGCSRECLTKNMKDYADRKIMSLNAGELVTNSEESGREDR